MATAGLYSQSEFFGGVMEKMTLPQFVSCTALIRMAVNTYTETAYTPEHREGLRALINVDFANNCRQ